jgi:uncharacterized membrane protein
MKKILLVITFIFGARSIGSACPFCNKNIMDGIYNSQFYPNLLIMLSAFIVLALIVALLTRITAKQYKVRTAASTGNPIPSPVPLTTASMVLGIGMGGFIDGIVLHQILQVHEMLSNRVAATDYTGKSINMFWDGIFHFFCLIVVLVGIVLMWKLLSAKNVDRSGRLLAGGLLLGWGLFNIVEGIIDHHILKLHNVIELSANHDLGNYAFLGISVLMLIGGYALAHKGNRSGKPA